MTRPIVQGILAFLLLGVFVFAAERTSAGPDKIAFPESYACALHPGMKATVEITK